MGGRVLSPDPQPKRSAQATSAQSGRINDLAGRKAPLISSSSYGHSGYGEQRTVRFVCDDLRVPSHGPAHHGGQGGIVVVWEDIGNVRIGGEVNERKVYLVAVRVEGLR